MRASPRPTVTIDLSKVRANATEIARRTGVPVIAVVKADAYGLGARRIVPALADLVAGFYVLDAAEMLAWEDLSPGKPIIALLTTSDDPNDYISRHIRPAVWTAERATLLRKARPVLSVDTGHQRFACPVDQLDAIIRTGACDEAFTHATRIEQARMLRDAARGKVRTVHAAGTVLLNDGEAWLDAVRPGLALYQGAVRVTAPLIEARDEHGPAGYTGFSSPTARHGVVLAGYCTGLRPGGPCVIGGARHKVPELGMQSAFVDIGADDKIGDEVVLLGDGVTEQDIADAWGTTPHEALLRMAGIGERVYLNS
jgi:alanine racemase